MVQQQMAALGLKMKRPVGRPRIHPVVETGLPDDVRCPPGHPHGARPAWTAFIVSVKRASDPIWPVRDASKIALARQRSDDGTHIMTQQTTKEGWVFLYSRPVSGAPT